MAKNIVFISALLISLISCEAQKQSGGFSIQGQIRNQAEGTKVYFEELTFGAQKGIDTATLDKKGNFELEGIIPVAGLYQVRVGTNQNIFLVLDEKSKALKISADTSDLRKVSYKIEGSATSLNLRDFISGLQAKSLAMNQASKDYNANAASSDSVKAKLAADLQTANDAFRSYVKQFVDSTTNPILGIFAVYNLNFKTDQDSYDKLAQMLNTYYSSLPFAQGFLKQLTEMKSQASYDPYAPKYKIGEVPPEITMNDVNGSPMSLSSLRGQYVLLDFWASWCGPCRKENPVVVNAYNTFMDKGFTIFSVSLDNDKNKWLAAIQKDKLTWSYHVSQLKGWQSPICQEYGISSIPTNYLLDREGKVIAYNLRGAELYEKLNSTLQ